MLCVGGWSQRVLGVRGYVRVFSPMLMQKTERVKVEFRSGSVDQLV